MQLHHATLELPESAAGFPPAKLTPFFQDAVAFLRRFECLSWKKVGNYLSSCNL